MSRPEVTVSVWERSRHTPPSPPPTHWVGAVPSCTPSKVWPSPGGYNQEEAAQILAEAERLKLLMAA